MGAELKAGGKGLFMEYIIGIDIGGTKLSMSLASLEGETVTLRRKIREETPRGYPAAREAMLNACRKLKEEAERSGGSVTAVGISCGGPLDSEKGVILSPPNLIGWDDIHIVEDFSRELGASVYLENDANACALAEWRFGAGRGVESMVFLTFGTGFGAGLILDGRLYRGTNGMAGELGHCLAPGADGSCYSPVGYGKAGSFEGYCSGGGLAQLSRMMALERLQRGESVSYCDGPGGMDGVTAKTVADAAMAGDPLAREVYGLCGRVLGAGLSLLVDLLNPEAIVIGSIYSRSAGLLEAGMTEALRRESLPRSLAACRVVPAQMDETLGDVAAISTALHGLYSPEHFPKEMRFALIE